MNAQQIYLYMYFTNLSALISIYLHLTSIFPIKCVGGLGALMRAWLHRYANQHSATYIVLLSAYEVEVHWISNTIFEFQTLNFEFQTLFFIFPTLIFEFQTLFFEFPTKFFSWISKIKVGKSKNNLWISKNRVGNSKNKLEIQRILFEIQTLIFEIQRIIFEIQTFIFEFQRIKLEKREKIKTALIRFRNHY